VTKITNNGGPLFPFEYRNKTDKHQAGFYGTGVLPPGAAQQFGGASMLEWFAGMALNGILACPRDFAADGSSQPVKRISEEAKIAVDYAAALVAEIEARTAPSPQETLERAMELQRRESRSKRAPRAVPRPPRFNNY
jgi:hypothetical protein